ncbi:unnamed protein product [Cercopithifilaria johnstoni]|uniref:Uncharacterized protein n=1 Tax=Cercopithifilaria johnstoni TaxID=2874296 RepID=A0A8J2MES8_9BILA|nr:unnamed protein product [Cercopithifilaria johnstoni]
MENFADDDYWETVPGGNGTWRTSQCGGGINRTTSAIIFDFKIAFQYLLSWGLLLSIFQQNVIYILPVLNFVFKYGLVENKEIYQRRAMKKKGVRR